MQFKHHLAFFLAAVTVATSQSLASLPACTVQGATAAMGATICGTDTACLCNSPTFISSLTQYAKTNCNDADYNTTLSIGQAICAQYGVTVNAAGTSSTMTTTASNMTMTSSTTAMTSMSSTSVPMSTSKASVSGIIISTKCTCEEITITPAVATPIATYTGAAMRVIGEEKKQSVFAGLMGALGLLALL